MFLQHHICKRLQRALHRRHLYQDISTVAVLIQHLSDSVQLSSHAVQPVFQLFFRENRDRE